MKKIIAFAGSNSSSSINHKLVTYVAGLAQQAEVEVIKLTDYSLPIYSEDIEKENGFPKPLAELMSKIKEGDGVIIAMNEHNSGWSSFFKNTMDWLSRLERSYLEGIPVLLVSTSPGGRGGQSSMDFGVNNLPRVGAQVIHGITVPRFYNNFDQDEGVISEPELKAKLQAAMADLEAAL
ncbi:NADPH-dependent FMN reductase [Aureitalea marina]|uniref:NADPH-dependent FMN reductase-like domain-containing protein n=1 Tax=Aureitalea marina TaxID=930804 RepID=A0A2S7KNE7_9FLAO|nr:NAD(P)H-dependent oxidoreductase [Aureitalea marina]PQB04142.1 hypothetical protein BST85_03920 [Aureitalea marina]